jgi:hypothetical protein
MSEAAKLASSQDYVMPKPHLGLALWKFSPSSTEYAVGVITKIGDRAVNMTVYADGFVKPIVKTGVRHVSDPGFSKLMPSAQDQGVWDYTDSDKMLLELQA